MMGNTTRVTPLREATLESSASLKALPWVQREAQGVSTLFHVNARMWMSGILLATDLFGFFLAILISSRIFHTSLVKPWSSHNGILLVLMVMLPVLFYRKGLYPAMGMHYVDELRNMITSTLLAFSAKVGVSVVIGIGYFVPTLLLAGILTLLFIPVGRYAMRKLFIRWKMWGEPVVIIGEGEKAQAVTDYFTINLQFGIRPVVVLNDPISVPDRGWLCPALPVCRIKLFVRNLSLKTALIVIDDLNDIDRLVERYRFVFQRVILIKPQNGSYGLASLRSMDFLDLMGLQVRNDLLSASSQVSKRIADLLISFLGVLFLSPFFGLIALLIKLDSRGKVFYRQPRLGRNGQVFHVLKFRTMYEDADRIFKDAVSHDPELQEEWDRFQKLKDDPRVTRMGRILRKFSLDELPQLWNVWKGEMSLAGPRPIMVDQRKLYGESFKLYIRVAPGMTGLWQISGRNETTFSRRAALDMEYIQRWSHWLDLYILFKTVKVVVWRDGAY
jgi:Undecaprenyl-phosphate galactose phosphotransferase WbaP